MSAAADRAAAIARMLDDARRWNDWAERMNAKALAAGLVTAEELERNRQAAEAAIARLAQSA